VSGRACVCVCVCVCVRVCVCMYVCICVCSTAVRHTHIAPAFMSSPSLPDINLPSPSCPLTPGREHLRKEGVHVGKRECVCVRPCVCVCVLLLAVWPPARGDAGGLDSVAITPSLPD
jgi:hypothetical protein